ncbi:proteasome subunit [Nitzschia inconspicua]|uniref:Proteasome subunit n=1 Tax=Nitzschia inconspicua TaxID=303405 RepID=A0A9K3KY07_9STRA|nr:proteasome subunit [Nitzschia inconspicua]
MWTLSFSSVMSHRVTVNDFMIRCLFFHLLFVSSTLSLKQRDAYPKQATTAATTISSSTVSSSLGTSSTSSFMSSSSSGLEDIPWSSESSSSSFLRSSILEASRYEDFPPIVFSPRGRLHKVEAALKASKLVTPRSNVVVAMKCRHGLLLVTTVPTSPFLNTTTTIQYPTTTGDNEQDATTTTTSFRSLFLLDETCKTTTTSPIVLDGPLFPHDLVAATGGNAVDGKLLRHALSSLISRDIQSVSGLEPFGHHHHTINDPWHVISAKKLARDMANLLQVATQDLRKATIPLLASSLVILGQDEIWRIDPTGQFWNCHLTVIGQDSDAVETSLFRLLLQKFKTKTHQKRQIRQIQQQQQQQRDTVQGVDNDNGTDDDDDDDDSKKWWSMQTLIEYMESMPYTDALDLVKECLTSHYVSKRNKHESMILSSGTDQSSTIHPTNNNNNNNNDNVVPQVYWHAVILDYNNGKEDENDDDKDDDETGTGTTKQPASRKICNKIVKRGSLVLSNPNN